MCRNIKTLFNFEPPATELEIRDASLQFVRKLSGFNVPSKANEEAFDRAVEEIAASTRVLRGFARAAYSFLWVRPDAMVRHIDLPGGEWERFNLIAVPAGRRDRVSGLQLLP